MTPNRSPFDALTRLRGALVAGLVLAGVGDSPIPRALKMFSRSDPCRRKLAYRGRATRRRGSGGSLLVRRLAVLLSLLFVTVATPVTVHASVSTFQAKGTFPDDNDLTVGPLIGGTGSYVEGTYAWTGYPYSDTTKYPGDGNLANLIQLQFSFTPRGELRIRAILETLLKTLVDQPLLGVGFDTDNDPKTGAPSVPGGGWIADGKIGLDTFVTVSSKEATLRRWNGSELWEVVGSFDSEVDPETNSMSTIVPKTLLRPGRATWRTVGVLGLGGDNSWVEGKGAIYNLAFVNCSTFKCIVESSGEAIPFTDLPDWQDGTQRDVLAGTLDSFEAVRPVEFSKIADGVTELAPITTCALAAAQPPFCYHTLLYYSNLNLGEGFRMTTDNPSCAQVPCTIYAGPYQPYLVQVPNQLGQPAPVIFHLHGDNHNHLNSLGCTNDGRSNCSLGAFSDFDFSDFVSPPLIVYPMGRGTHLSWGGGDGAFGFPLAAGAYAEADVLSVLDDVTKRFQIDRDRVVIHGMSLGAVGAFKIAEYHPDLFAGVLAASGADCCILPVNHFQPRRLENLINVPVRMFNGAVDPLAHVGAAADTWVALDRLGDVDYLGFEAFPRHHEEFDDLADCILHGFLKERTRVLDPARVVYIIDPAHEVTDRATGLDMTHHGAYWVSGLEVRGAAEARIDVTTKARAIRTTVGKPINELEENFTEGADYCGPNPAVKKNNVWVVHGILLDPGEAQSTSNGMDLTLLQYSRAALDLMRMGISVSDAISISVTGDGTSEVELVGPWHEGQKVDVTKDGGAFARLVATDGAVILKADFSETHHYVLTPEERKGRGQSDCTSASQNCERDFENQSHPEGGNAPPADMGLPLHRLSNTASADGDRVLWPAVFALLAGAGSQLMITRRRDA